MFARKMLHTDNIIRPRRNNHGSWLNAIDAQKINNRTPIFKLQENEFVLTVPQINYGEQKYHKRSDDGVIEKTNKSLGRNMIHQLETYCDKTTLHGLRYVGDTSLSFGERIFWFISFSVAIGFAAYYISNIYKKWNSSPVIISFSPFDADLSSIPFPAITICNMNQAKKNEAEKILKEGPVTEKKLLDDYCTGNNSFAETEETSWESLRNFLVKVGQSCSDILKVCHWRNDAINCEEAFNNDLTDEGLCCSFNRLPPEKIFRNARDIAILNQTYPGNIYDWSPEKGFVEKDTGDETIIPRRPLGAGVHLGLTLILDAQIDNYFCSSTSSVGFKLLLANPIETPKMADFGFLLGPGTETRISIVPSIREATDSLRDIDIEKRQCYFSNERPLKYYRSYTLRNCNLECQSNYTLSQCSCVPYFLPKNKEIKTCGKADQDCSNRAKEDMEVTFGNGSSCHCLPGCFEMNYSEKKSESKLSEKMNISGELGNTTSHYFVKNMAVVHFYFQATKFTKQIKSELYGFTEILSNVGGLLGLCLGFSFLSLVELFYFVTLRVLCFYGRLQMKRRQRKKQGKAQKSDNDNTSNMYQFVK